MSGPAIKGGYVYGTGEHDAILNSVVLTDITAEAYVSGAHLLLGNGKLEDNSVSLVGSSISGFVTGALQESGQGDEVHNSVEAKNTNVAGYVYGGYILNPTGSGDIRNNEVSLSKTTVEGDGVTGGLSYGNRCCNWEHSYSQKQLGGEGFYHRRAYDRVGFS